MMLRLSLKDGSNLAITDHDQDIDFDLGDGVVTYSASTGILPSNLALSSGFDADDIEVQGPITGNGLTTLPAFLGGRFDDAVAELFQVNWSNLAQGAIKLLRGFTVLASVDGGKFKLTIHSEISKFHQTIGDVTSLYCRYAFGVAPCPAVPVTLAATVSGVTSAGAFAVTFTGTYASDYFNRGTVEFATGALAGTRPVEIQDFTGGVGIGSLILWTDLAAIPTIGDTLTITQGCYDLAGNQSKTRAACVVLLGSAVDFGGEPDLPGQDKMLTFPNPGAE